MVTVEVRKLPLNVVVLSRIPTFCADLCETMEGGEDLHVRTYATSPGEVFHAVRRYVVDLVVLDLRLKWTTICLVASSLDRQSVPSLVVGDSINAARGLDLLRHGASAMLERHSSAETLVGNLRAVASANIRMSRGLQQSALRLIQASE
jgi:DNA-binding NarL/FixJ family response regulator